MKDLDEKLIELAKVIVEEKNVEALEWLILVRKACAEHEWGNLRWRAFVLYQILGRKCIRFLWVIDRFASSHGVDLNKV